MFKYNVDEKEEEEESSRKKSPLGGNLMCNRTAAIIIGNLVGLAVLAGIGVAVGFGVSSSS